MAWKPMPRATNTLPSATPITSSSNTGWISYHSLFRHPIKCQVQRTPDSQTNPLVIWVFAPLSLFIEESGWGLGGDPRYHLYANRPNVSLAIQLPKVREIRHRDQRIAK